MYFVHVYMFVFVCLFAVCIYIVCLSRAPLKISVTEWTLKIIITIFPSTCLCTFSCHNYVATTLQERMAPGIPVSKRAPQQSVIH